MSGLGKLLFGAAVTGAAAYGVYSFLQKYRVEIKPIDEEAENTVDGSADFVEEKKTAEEEDAAEEGHPHEGKTFDAGRIFDPEKAAAAAGTIKDAANRAYTTIQHGSQQAADAVRDTVIPKGAEVVNKVKNTVIPKGQEIIDKVKGAVQVNAEMTSDEETGDAEEAPASEETKTAEVSATEEPETKVSGTTETFVSDEEKQEEKTDKKDETIEFFDDEG